MSHVGPGWSPTWRTHSCVPCRDSSRHLLCSLTRCASPARGPGVEKSLDAARRSACATSATTCPTLAHPVSSTSGGLSLALADVNLETALGELGSGAAAGDAFTEDGDDLRKRTS